MRIACCIWALSLPETDLLRQVRAMGFDWIDIQPSHLHSLESRLLAQELGLSVSCLGASFGMPAGAALDSHESAARAAAIRHVGRGIALAAEVSAETIYVVPGKVTNDDALKHYAESLCDLAGAAAAYSIKLAIEHFPGTNLATAHSALEFILRTGHPNLYLLIDSGHLQISGEDPQHAIANAGDRLAYVHLDDNDGLGDLHWSLLDGLMTEESLAAMLMALEDIGYQGALSLELSPDLPRPVKALAESRDILLRAMHLRQWQGVDA